MSSISGCLKTIHLRFLHADLNKEASPKPNSIETKTFPSSVYNIFLDSLLYYIYKIIML